LNLGWGGDDVAQQEFAGRIAISQNYVSDVGMRKTEIGAETLLMSRR
jgi:hypothetical protein